MHFLVIANPAILRNVVKTKHLAGRKMGKIHDGMLESIETTEDFIGFTEPTYPI
jgi:hypothetical protein